MKRKNLPAWQRVLLVVLRNVPEARNGHDAWTKLKEEEQTAIMDYLTEHCGDEAQAKLEETCGKMKHSRWTALCWASLIVVAFIVAWMCMMFWIQRVLDIRVTSFVWLVLCPINMHTAWQGNPAGKSLQIWKDYWETRTDTAVALNSMHLAYTAPRKERMNKIGFYCWLGLWLLYGGLTLLDVFTR